MLIGSPTLKCLIRKTKRKKKKAEEIKLFLNNHSQRLVLDGVVQSISQANRGHERAKEVSSVFPLTTYQMAMEDYAGRIWTQLGTN